MFLNIYISLSYQFVFFQIAFITKKRKMAIYYLYLNQPNKNHGQLQLLITCSQGHILYFFLIIITTTKQKKYVLLLKIIGMPKVPYGHRHSSHHQSKRLGLPPRQCLFVSLSMSHKIWCLVNCWLGFQLPLLLSIYLKFKARNFPLLLTTTWQRNMHRNKKAWQAVQAINNTFINDIRSGHLSSWNIVEAHHVGSTWRRFYVKTWPNPKNFGF